jgi:hypothetical protein
LITKTVTKIGRIIGIVDIKYVKSEFSYHSSSQKAPSMREGAGDIL